MNKRSLPVFFLIFTASGFAGLIYESIWTHYLKLFLGHAAYAQALVLAVFMGGMAIGSLLCAKYSERIGNLLTGYAVVEAVIGICAVLFHPLYAQFTDLAYARFIPALGSPAAVTIFKWCTAILLILPQSILLGMTFPLMTAGLLRRFPDAPGSTIAMLYFTNSIGAAIGVLASGFLFIGWVGLPGTLVIAGFINITVAAVVWLESKQIQAGSATAYYSANTTIQNATPPFVYTVFLVIALLTGLSSFIYEIGWIRMLSLVLGSSTHAFELMLSAFIMGLAFGGFWIKGRIDSLDDPRRFLALVQIAMGILALATLPMYGRTFNIMAWLIKHLPKTEIGYMLFNVTSHGISMIIMLPAAFCAGMTLPLITTSLLRNGAGEKSIGAVYGFNTIGSILGVFSAIHFAMPLLGLKGTIIIGAGIDITLGIGLAWWLYPSWRVRTIYATVGVAALLMPSLWVKLDPDKMASGVYRHGTMLNSTKEETIFHHDGKTATVSVTSDAQYVTIRTNGKPDAQLNVAGIGITEDEYTTVMLGSIGTILQPKSSTAAVIGWGSGLSTHVLLTSPNIKSVDTIEIEPEIVKAAKLFGSRVHLAYDDPRSHLRIEDAKSYFSFHKTKYDLIISEPSNPWVSGVASLFTEEFYSRVRSYLNEDGLLVQWIQLYEIDMPLVASIMKALSPYFSDYIIYGANTADIIVVARPTGTIGPPDPLFTSMKSLASELKRINILGTPDINVRLIGSKSTLSPFINSYDITVNSDYAPVVDLYAVKSRFFRLRATEFTSSLELGRLPINQMLGRQYPDLSSANVTLSSYPKTQNIHLAELVYHYFIQNTWNWGHPDNPISDGFLRSAIHAKQILTKKCSEKMLEKDWWKTMLNTTATIAPYLSMEQVNKLIQFVEAPSCARHFSNPQRSYISLVKAVRKRDAALMTQYSISFLTQRGSNLIDAENMEYVLTAGMLGSLSSGDTQQARLLWNKYGGFLPNKNSQSFATRLLVSHLFPQEQWN